MLVLTRLRDESIVIGDDIRVTVVDVRGDKVRIGIEAPRSVTVHRDEVYRAIRDDKPEDRRVA
ncbi:MAG: carbon storage regulator CsrA [Planctomycetota bacterium]